MVSRSSEKKKAKRKAKLKQRRSAQQDNLRLEKAAYCFEGAQYHLHMQNYQKALQFIRKALKLNPDNTEYLYLLAQIGNYLEDADAELEALSRLHQLGRLEDRSLPAFINRLTEKEDYELALEMGNRLLERLPGMSLPNKRKLRTGLKRNQEFCRSRLADERRMAEFIRVSAEIKAGNAPPKTPVAKPAAPASPTPRAAAAPTPPEAPPQPVLPDIPVSVTIDEASFQNALSSGVAADHQEYTLVQEARRIRFMDAFESLICFSDLKNVRSFWYQEETARKVLKTFRGRALLSDEVGLGKTIEASMVLKEYIQRGMVKSALILTPTPLVSQWREELKSKFALDFPSTDDPVYRSGEQAFWEQPLVLASINQAKSKRNFEMVTGREYDLVIVDEAHHLKNRNTLNWKLVNALQKRFLLLLTATPVENNLMELYNLITLLKPGQLKTATAFREEFMTRGDPTSPQNRARLKELLGQVMIRNTRAVAKINIPPRFAETVRVEPTGSERELYERISTLVQSINRTGGAGNKLLLKNLLAEAGSSPRAVELTLSRMVEKKDLSADHRRQIQAIGTLSRSMADTRKNRILYDIIRATPGKKIVFVKYIGTLEHIMEFLSWEKIPFAVFHGRMTNSEKDEQIDLFRNQRDILVTTEVGGEGRNLQFCHQMINYDLPWNPMKIEQRIGRLHRIGQEKEVRIFNLCAAGSVEDYILEILDRKINMFEMVIGEIEMVLGRVSGEKDFSDRVIDIWLASASAKERKAGFARLGTQIKRSKTQYETTKTLDEKLFGENYEL